MYLIDSNSQIQALRETIILWSHHGQLQKWTYQFSIVRVFLVDSAQVFSLKFSSENAEEALYAKKTVGRLFRYGRQLLRDQINSIRLILYLYILCTVKCDSLLICQYIVLS